MIPLQFGFPNVMPSLNPLNEEFFLSSICEGKAFSPFRRRAERTDVAESAFTLEHDHSVLGHTTDTEADYGTALCWAENAVGAQKAPCAFREDARRARQAVTNCHFRHTGIG